MAVKVFGSGSITGLTDAVASNYHLGANGIIRTNINTISENLTIPANTNGMSAGPVTVNTNYTVTVLGTWTVV